MQGATDLQSQMAYKTNEMNSFFHWTSEYLEELMEIKTANMLAREALEFLK